MTNLLEKGLIIGFGILTLLIFFSLINPFLDAISEFNNDEKYDVDKYINFIDEMDDAILYVIDNPEENFLKTIEYPSNLNISLNDNYAKYDFINGNEHQSRIIFYKVNFIDKNYKNLLAKTYLLNISYILDRIKVEFIDFY